jgi:hypothetical protein
MIYVASLNHRNLQISAVARSNLTPCVVLYTGAEINILILILILILPIPNVAESIFVVECIPEYKSVFLNRFSP